MDKQNIKLNFTAYYGRVSIDIKIDQKEYKMDLWDLRDYIIDKIVKGKVKFVEGKGNLKARVILK